MSLLSNLINEENGFLVKLRCENKFDEDDYNKIKNELILSAVEWKKINSVSVDDFVAIISLTEQLAGGSRFLDEDTAIKVEDACIDIIDIINDLL